MWLAEWDGRVVGLIAAEPPPEAGWIAPAFAISPIAYIECLGVDPAARGRGVGTALLATAHHALDAVGVAGTVLHHAAPNPRSTPFYYRHGYRPAYTIWEVRPARALR